MNVNGRDSPANSVSKRASVGLNMETAMNEQIAHTLLSAYRKIVNVRLSDGFV
jgi:hypothetical protein